MDSFEYLTSFYSNQPFISNTKNYLADNHIKEILREYSNKEELVDKNNFNKITVKNIDFNKNKFKNIDYVLSSNELSSIYVNNDNGKLTTSLV